MPAEHRIEFARRLRGRVGGEVGEEQLDRGEARGFLAGAGKFAGKGVVRHGSGAFAGARAAPGRITRRDTQKNGAKARR